MLRGMDGWERPFLPELAAPFGLAGLGVVAAVGDVVAVFARDRVAWRGLVVVGSVGFGFL